MRTPLLACALAAVAASAACNMVQRTPPKQVLATPTFSDRGPQTDDPTVSASAVAAAPGPDEGPVNPVAWKPGLPEALSDHAKSCDRGEVTWCTVVASTYETDPDLKDLPRVTAIYLKLCGSGDASACEKAGNLVLAGTGVAADPVQGNDLLNKACEGDRTDACLALAAHYGEGEGVKKDPKKAKAYLAKACLKGVAPACDKKATPKGAAKPKP